jgi:hypothetical protein
MPERTCSCGSGKPRRVLEDARGIFVAYVCDECEKRIKAQYRPDIFLDPNYPCDEQVEEEE